MPCDRVGLNSGGVAFRVARKRWRLNLNSAVANEISSLSFGRVFTANMTGNIVLLAFATARVAE